MPETMKAWTSISLNTFSVSNVYYRRVGVCIVTGINLTESDKEPEFASSATQPVSTRFFCRIHLVMHVGLTHFLLKSL